MSVNNTLFIELLYILDAVLICLAVYEWEQRKDRFLLAGGMAAALFVWSLCLTSMDKQRNLPAIPERNLLHWLVLLVFFLISVWLFVYRRKWGRNRLSTTSVKEALDDLPGGVCFFGRNGLPVLCNRKMYAIAYELLGRDLQTEEELADAISALPDSLDEIGTPPEGHYYQASDGRIWMFRQSRVDSGNRDPYTRILAYDMTQLYQMSQMRKQRNEDLQKMIDRLSQITENIAAITREQEILSAKMLVHNRMGSCILTSRRYLTRGLPREEKAEIAEGWRQMLSMLYNSTDSTVESIDEFQQLRSLADSLGIDLQIDGAVPVKENIRRCMASAVREALTNTISHAGGTRMDVVIRQTEREIRIEITNDGEKPDGPVREGGGLSSLRRLTESSGGIMEVVSEPAFCLRLIFPEREETV